MIWYSVLFVNAIIHQTLFHIFSGFCSSNPLGAAQCEALFQSQGGLAFCATNFMLENCCLYCSQVTVATTTPGPTVSIILLLSMPLVLSWRRPS